MMAEMRKRGGKGRKGERVERYRYCDVVMERLLTFIRLF